ncbi:MAG: N-6 DNA methylase [candidate division NC10 bacterium]|nr:N-6 DNA methylase [candidate division NC10 bacterium]
MPKRTKLKEKAARMPEIRQHAWDEAVSQYLREVEQLNKETARSHRFAVLLQQLLGVEPNFIEAYSAGIERSLKVRQKDCILKGEADNLFGNVIIEFETSIPKKRPEAEDQLRRYVAILWSQEQPGARTPYLCVSTDGVRFVTYSPSINTVAARDISPAEVHLQVLEEADWTKLKPHEVFYWLDRYFLRKEILHPTSEMIVVDFGLKSHAFQTSTNALLALWQEIQAQSSFAVMYESWEKYLRIVYGSEVTGDELFIRHTYLATLAKLMSWMRIAESTNLPDDAQIIEMLEGQLFKKQGIENFIEEDFFSWLARPAAVKVGVGVVRWLFSLLQNYNLRELSEDVLKSLYQELVDPETRHDLGEFYTPDWLAHRIVRRLLDANPRGTMLDPACGSGTFLYLAIREKRERLGDSQETLSHILDSVCGADIHPLAVIIAKTNYILALGDLLKKRKRAISLPIYLADTLKLPERYMKGPEYEIRVDSKTIYGVNPILS